MPSLWAQTETGNFLLLSSGSGLFKTLCPMDGCGRGSMAQLPSHAEPQPCLQSRWGYSSSLCVDINSPHRSHPCGFAGVNSCNDDVPFSFLLDFFVLEDLLFCELTFIFKNTFVCFPPEFLSILWQDSFWWWICSFTWTIVCLVRLLCIIPAHLLFAMCVPYFS